MKRFSTLLRILLSGGLLVALFYFVDVGEMAQTIAQSNPYWVLLAYAIGIVDRVIMAYKWNLLLRAKNITIPLLNTTTTYLSSTFFGLFLPATVGGDAFRILFVKREGHDASDVTSSIVIERILGMIALMAFVMGSIVLSVLVLGERFFDDIWGLFWATTAFFVATLVILAATLNQRLVKLGASLLERFNRYPRLSKVNDLLRKIYRSYATYRNAKGTLALFLGLSFVENIFPIMWTYLLALAFNIEVPLFYFFILVPIALILRRLPISIDGTGLHEGAFVYFLSLIGVATEQGLLLGIATHALAVALVLPGGLFYMFGGVKARGNAPDTVPGNTPDTVGGQVEKATVSS